MKAAGAVNEEDESMKPFKGKKGTEITFNTIIIAILVLIVLVVMVLILTGAFGDIVPQLGSQMTCEGREGNCKDPCDEGEYKIYKFGGCGEDNKPNYCCIPKG